MATRKIRLFYSYAHKDESLREQLEKHLSALRQEGQLEDWHDRNISAGKEWEQEISTYLEGADIILGRCLALGLTTLPHSTLCNTRNIATFATYVAFATLGTISPSPNTCRSAQSAYK